MNTISWSIYLALILTLLFCVSAGGAWADPIDHPYVPGEFIIKFKPGTSDNVKTLILSDLNAEHIKGFGRIKSELKRLGSLTVEEAIARYEGHPNIEYIERDALRYPMAETTPWGVPAVQAEPPPSPLSRKG